MRRNPLLFCLIIFIFFIISFLTNIIGPLVPDIIKSFNLSLKMASFLPLSFFAAYGLMSIPSGFLIELFGEKKIILTAFTLASIGAFIFANVGTFGFYLFSLFLIGTGMAMLQVAINPLLRTVGGEREFAFNSVLGQMFFGLASFISPLVYSYIITNVSNDSRSSNPIINSLSNLILPEMEWISLYWIFALISSLMVLLISLIKIPAVEKKDDEKIGAIETHFKLLKNPVVILYFIAIFSYVGTEVGIANWISQFLETYHNVNPQLEGAKTVSNFWGMMTLGTLLGLVLLKFIDSRKVLVFNSIVSIITLLIALFGSGEQAMIAFPIIGFFIATMWSIIISLALNSMPDSHGSFSGILVTGIIGGALVPFFVGSIGDLLELKIGMLFLIFTLLYILSVGFWAKPLINNTARKI